MVGFSTRKLPPGTKLSGIDAVFLDPQTHESLGDSQGPRRPRLVPPRGAKGDDDHFLFHPAEGCRHVFDHLARLLRMEGAVPVVAVGFFPGHGFSLFLSVRWLLHVLYSSAILVPGGRRSFTAQGTR